MSKFCDYSGQKVLVVGCASGIGRATAKGLMDLGAEVIGVDVADCDLPLARFQKCDARSVDQIDKLLAETGAINALFYCSGLPQTKPFLDVLKVNFLGMRCPRSKMVDRSASLRRPPAMAGLRVRMW